jgi:hypothetical protein
MKNEWCGNFDGSKITLWSSNREVGIFYPVFEIKRSDTNNNAPLRIVNRMNIAGKILGFLFASGFWLPLIVIILNIDFKNTAGIVLSLFLASIFGIIPVLLYKIIYPREVERQEQFIKDVITEYLAGSADYGSSASNAARSREAK